jgi:hypothetical protein
MAIVQNCAHVFSGNYGKDDAPVCDAHSHQLVAEANLPTTEKKGWNVLKRYADAFPVVNMGQRFDAILPAYQVPKVEDYFQSVFSLSETGTVATQLTLEPDICGYV